MKHDNLDNLYYLTRLPGNIERFEKIGRVVKYAENVELNIVDEVPEYCYAIKSGRVICYEYTITGEMRLYKFLEEGTFFMEEFVLFDRPCDVLFKTLVPTELILIDKCSLKKAFKEDIDLVLDVCDSLSTKYLSAMKEIRRGNFYSSSWKICKLLMAFVDSYGVERYGKMIINEKISHQMVSDILGMNRITVTRKLKELRNMGLIGQINGYYYVENIEKFEEHMESIKLNYESKRK